MIILAIKLKKALSIAQDWPHIKIWLSLLLALIQLELQLRS
jgi:hypothetical protein